jgi:hypothetical protein
MSQHGQHDQRHPVASHHPSDQLRPFYRQFVKPALSTQSAQHDQLGRYAIHGAPSRVRTTDGSAR